ncbi:MAG: hypothetical protein JO020_17145 [Chloroflexi bacterium]|nr:hypothetical protein [Chloroflexota bacterium]
MTTTTSTREMTLGPLTAEQRTDIMRFAPSLSVEARQLFRRLLILRQDGLNGLTGETIARAAAQASAHFEA